MALLTQGKCKYFFSVVQKLTKPTHNLRIRLLKEVCDKIFVFNILNWTEDQLESLVDTHTLNLSAQPSQPVIMFGKADYSCWPLLDEAVEFPRDSESFLRSQTPCSFVKEGGGGFFVFAVKDFLPLPSWSFVSESSFVAGWQRKDFTSLFTSLLQIMAKIWLDAGHFNAL